MDKLDHDLDRIEAKLEDMIDTAALLLNQIADIQEILDKLRGREQGGIYELVERKKEE